MADEALLNFAKPRHSSELCSSILLPQDSRDPQFGGTTGLCGMILRTAVKEFTPEEAVWFEWDSLH